MDDVGALGVEAEVQDLLLFFRACVGSGRRDLLLDPWPSVPDPAQPHILAIDPKYKDGDALQNILSRLPCPSVLFQPGFTDEMPEELPIRLYRWVMANNQSRLLSLPEQERLSFLPTQHQFVLLEDSPAKEAAFQRAKKEYGRTVFAFHGSPLCNWHSIMRKGLLVASNTQYMLHGASQGAGIYLSESVATSIGHSQSKAASPYAQSNDGAVMARCGGQTVPGHSCTANRFLGDPASLICFAICEVVDSPSLKRYGAMLVAEVPEHVSTRFLVLLPRNAVTSDLNRLCLTAPDVSQSLAKAMEFRAKQLS